MSGHPEIMRQSELLHRLVLDRRTTEELGRVEVVWMHPPAHRVLGFICKAGRLGAKRYAFNLNQLHQLGAQSIVVTSKPVETNATEIGYLETLVGHELWSEAGDKIGKIIDCLFNIHSGVITQYLFRSDGWRGFTGGVYLLPTSQISSFGKKRVLISASATQNFSIYREGIEQKLSQVGDRVSDSYVDVTQELRSLSEQAQGVTQQAKGTLQQLTDQASAQVQSITEQAAHNAKTVGQQLQAETQTLAHSVKQQGQSFMEQLQQRIPILNEKIEDRHQSKSESNPDIDPSQSGKTTRGSAEDWSVDLDQIPLEDLEDDQPWI